MVKVGAVDATVHGGLGSQYDVRGYPTIKIFPPGAKTARSAQDYQGPRQASGIIDYGEWDIGRKCPRRIV